MLESLGKSLSNIIDERLSNPLVVSFVIAWVGWNYKFFVLLFSNTPAIQTFELIKKHSFPDWQAYTFNGFLFPLGTTLAYIYILPYLSKYVNDHWRGNQLQDSRNRQKYSDQQLLTVDESREYRARERKLDDEIERLFRIIEGNKKDLQAADAKNAEQSKAMAAMREQFENDIAAEIARTSGVKQVAESTIERNTTLVNDLERVNTELRMLQKRLVTIESEQPTRKDPNPPISIGNQSFPYHGFMATLRSIANGMQTEVDLLKLGFDSKENIKTMLNAMLTANLINVATNIGTLQFSITQKGRDFLTRR